MRVARGAARQLAGLLPLRGGQQCRPASVRPAGQLGAQRRPERGAPVLGRGERGLPTPGHERAFDGEYDRVLVCSSSSSGAQGGRTQALWTR